LWGKNDVTPKKTLIPQNKFLATPLDRAGFSWWGAWGPAIGVGDGRGALPPLPLPPQKNPGKIFFSQS